MAQLTKGWLTVHRFVSVPKYCRISPVDWANSHANADTFQSATNQMLISLEYSCAFNRTGNIPVPV
jgi:hypothetical protein